MIRFENTEVSGWVAAIRGMRNPLNSWSKSDSFHGCRAGDYGHIDSYDCDEKCKSDCKFCIGSNDLKLMQQLVKAGSDHSKFMRMINVTVDVTAPMYWWKEFDTYKVGTIRNSCSTMHTIHKKEFELDDFSHEKLFDMRDQVDYSDSVKYICNSKSTLRALLRHLNSLRENYIATNDKAYWYEIIQLLPSSYNQRATVQLNYAVLRNAYHSRKNHKLDEWSVGFVEWVESLPYSELITEV